MYNILDYLTNNQLLTNLNLNQLQWVQSLFKQCSMMDCSQELDIEHNRLIFFSQNESDRIDVRGIKNVDAINFGYTDEEWFFSFTKEMLIDNDVIDVQSMVMIVKYLECVRDVKLTVLTSAKYPNNVTVTIEGLFN